MEVENAKIKFTKVKRIMRIPYKWPKMSLMCPLCALIFHNAPMGDPKSWYFSITVCINALEQTTSHLDHLASQLNNHSTK